MAHKMTKADLTYSDYKWAAKADHDNPKIIGGNDHSQLNRTEGYEMLYFMNSLMHSWGWSVGSNASARNLERVIKTEVPHNIRTHSGIKQWIESNYSKL